MEIRRVKDKINHPKGSITPRCALYSHMRCFGCMFSSTACFPSAAGGGNKGVKKGNQTPPPRSVSFKRCFFVFLPFGPWFRRACDTERGRPAVI